MKRALKHWFPAAAWIQLYRRQDLRGDTVAGLTTAVMLVPQAMAYAMLAGLPPEVGLYASTAPLFLYALFGSSRQLAVGPVAMVSLLVAAGVGGVADGDPSSFAAYAVVLALMVGLIQLAMGVGRLGFLINFLSHPVISGFTSAAALIIGFSQFKHLLGIDLPRSQAVHEIIVQAAQRIGELEPYTLAIGLTSMALLYGIRRLNPLFPTALLVVVASSLVVWTFDLHSAGVTIVGSIPGGLPTPRFPTFDMSLLTELIPTALAISLVGFMESISVAQSFAARNRYELNANQELMGLGLANVGAGLVGGYPVTGGFSRTAVNAQAGARTGLASIITATVVVATLLFFTPLFYYLPKAVLAAVIMTAVFGLVDIKEIRHLRRVKLPDLALLLITFASTMAFGIETGIATGVGASLFWFVLRTTKPHTAVLGYLPSAGVFRNVNRHAAARTSANAVIVRVDAQWYFGNAVFLKDTIRSLVARGAGSVRTLIVDATSVNDLDSSAERALRDIADELRQQNIALHFANVKGPVMDVLQRAGFVEHLGPKRFHWSLEDAVRAAGHADIIDQPSPHAVSA